MIFLLLTTAGDAYILRPPTQHLWDVSEHVVKLQAIGSPSDKEYGPRVVRTQEAKVLAVYKGPLKVGQTITVGSEAGKVASRGGNSLINLSPGSTSVAFLATPMVVRTGMPEVLTGAVVNYHSFEVPNPLLMAELETLMEGQSLPEGYRPDPIRFSQAKFVVLASINPEGKNLEKGRSYPIEIKRVWKGPSTPGTSRLLLGWSQVEGLKLDSQHYVLFLKEKWDDGWVSDIKPYPADEKVTRLYNRMKF